MLNIDLKALRDKSVITWVFWKSHVTELCDKWICCRNNYALQGLKSFAHVQVKYFLLMNIMLSFQKIKQELTSILMILRYLKISLKRIKPNLRENLGLK